MVAKGRQARRNKIIANRMRFVGESNPSSKLTKDDVIEIRTLVKAGHLQKDLATRYGVHIVTVSDIAIGKTWAHLEAA